jgi:hypothetical protein
MGGTGGGSPGFRGWTFLQATVTTNQDYYYL